MAKMGRNELCPCGSGKKYKHCCMDKDGLSRRQGMMQDVFDEVREAMADRNFDSIDEANAFLRTFMEGKNRKPAQSFLGISPEQMHRLLRHSYDDTSDILDFNTGLSPSEFQEIPVVKHVLIFLRALSECEPVKATKKGNMSLGFSKDLFDKMYDIEKFPWLRGMRSEEEMGGILSLRHILTMCGWMKKRKGVFSLTKNGRTIVEEGFGGEHYLKLLKIFTTEFNWSFQDGFSELYIIQESFLFSLYLFKKKATDYVDGMVIADCLIDAYPLLLEGVNEAYMSADEIVGHCVELRVLKRFGVYFGFLVDKSEKREGVYRKRILVKTTDFFRSFISWHIA
ncbi:MAG: SEC-C domain-containing protein [Thermodesulfobacteriota bacterium]|nr:SEC-C domain-containing protein [Thermodesulfobacteriota bacterium]